MKTTRIWMLAILFLALVATSCDKEDDPIDEAQVLVEYLESAAGGNYANTAMPAIVSAEHVHTMNTVGTNYIIDIRRAEDFTAGHIANAVNVPQTDVLTHLEGTTEDDDKEEIHIICYSGQSAAWATCLLRLAGYSNAFSMKFGMSSWREENATPWQSNISNAYASQFVTEATPKGASGDLPVLNTGFEDAEDILAARIDEVFAAGFSAVGVGASTVFGALDNYYIVNYWPEADYTTYGHIPGSMQYTPKASISLDADLETLPADETVVVYCYTGQTSANMAAYLSVIGYDAKTLTFGVNGMIYDVMDKSKWSDDAIMGYEVVTE